MGRRKGKNFQICKETQKPLNPSFLSYVFFFIFIKYETIFSMRIIQLTTVLLDFIFVNRFGMLHFVFVNNHV